MQKKTNKETKKQRNKETFDRCGVESALHFGYWFSVYARVFGKSCSFCIYDAIGLKIWIPTNTMAAIPIFALILMVDDK
jgi:hypothetical protein